MAFRLAFLRLLPSWVESWARRAAVAPRRAAWAFLFLRPTSERRLLEPSTALRDGSSNPVSRESPVARDDAGASPLSERLGRGATGSRPSAQCWAEESIS